MYVCMYTCVYVRGSMHVYVCVCMCVYVCICIYVYGWPVSTGAYVHMVTCAEEEKYRTPRGRLKENASVDPHPPPPPPRKPLSSSEGEEDGSCQMATDCWLGLLMGPDGSSTLWGRSWVSPNVAVGVLAPKTTEGEKKAGNMEYI